MVQSSLEWTCEWQPLACSCNLCTVRISATVVSPATLGTMNAMVSINIPDKFPQGHLFLGCSQVTALLSVVYSAVRAEFSTTFLSPPSSPKSGSSKPLLEEGGLESGKKEKKGSKSKPVSYSYTFFHLIFALASMYSAMLLTGWTSSTSDNSELIDVGWTSTWVRILTEWASAVLYIWTLVALLVLPDRESY